MTPNYTSTNSRLKQQWRNSVEGIYTAVIAILICNIMIGIGSALAAFSSLFLIIPLIAILVGIFFMFSYYIKLGDWKATMPNANDAKQVGYIRFYALMQIISCIAGGGLSLIIHFVPSVGLITFIYILNSIISLAVLVGFILETIGAASLKKSNTLHERVRKGMKRIFTANILTIAITAICLCYVSYIAFDRLDDAHETDAFETRYHHSHGYGYDYDYDYDDYYDYEDEIEDAHESAIVAIIILLAIFGLGITTVVLRITGWSSISKSDYIDDTPEITETTDSTTQIIE